MNVETYVMYYDEKGKLYVSPKLAFMVLYQLLYQRYLTKDTFNC